MGNRQTLIRGQVQYMSAGTGVWHSEHNYGEGEATVWRTSPSQNETASKS
jgi:redox-sensitive bicupin YhaK (pirin superfamily)